jgi:hypothetical protein
MGFTLEKLLGFYYEITTLDAISNVLASPTTNSHELPKPFTTSFEYTMREGRHYHFIKMDHIASHEFK